MDIEENEYLVEEILLQPVERLMERLVREGMVDEFGVIHSIMWKLIAVEEGMDMSLWQAPNTYKY